MHGEGMIKHAKMGIAVEIHSILNTAMPALCQFDIETVTSVAKTTYPSGGPTFFPSF